MKKLIKHILTLIVILSLVHFTKDIIEFSKEIITLKDHQLSAKIREERMMHPTVKITSTIEVPQEISGLPNTRMVLSAATGFSVKYKPGTDTSIIVTNDHFCNSNLEKIEFVVEDYKNASIEINRNYLEAKLVLTNPDLDLCILEANGYIRPAKLASYHYAPRPFEEIFVVGGPTGVFPIIFDSYVSKTIERDSVTLGAMSKKGNHLILISEQVFPGHSGSPIFTKDGEVIGIIFGALKTYGGLAASVKDIYLMLEATGE